MARVMFAGWPFHLTHRGNHKERVFRRDADKAMYLALLRRFAEKHGMAIWAYCLMRNHVHMIAVGLEKTSISRAIGMTQSQYSRRVNLERDVTGHLWANRYFSSALDDLYLWAAVRYVELNPVRAGIVSDATRFPWSSARAHAGLSTDALLAPDHPFPGPIGDWKAWLSAGLEEETASRLRVNTYNGEPTGSEEFISEIEKRLGRPVRPRKREPNLGMPDCDDKVSQEPALGKRPQKGP
jgi:putative transposase